MSSSWVDCATPQWQRLRTEQAYIECDPAGVAQLAAASSSLDRHEIAARPAISASDQRPRKHPAEILVLIRGHRVQAEKFAVPFWPLARLGQNEESGGTCDQARG